MKEIKFIPAGGFLGAGKTTSLIRLAEYLHLMNLKVCMITNDQGSLLVDGGLAKARGIGGAEVQKGCFCCRFDDMIREMDTLIRQQDPDVILAEPTGSCTDLVATVFLPLAVRYPGRFRLMPYSVVLDGTLAAGLSDPGCFRFSGDIRYLYEKQMEESDILLLNKTDRMNSEDKSGLLRQLTARYPEKTILPVSALNGDGFEQWAGHLLQGEPGLNPLEELDYGRYGQAEALLGWYNASVCFEARRPFDPNDLVQDFLEGLARSTAHTGGNIAHLKVLGASQAGVIKASIVQTHEKAAFSNKAYDLVRRLDMIINARAELEPELLKGLVREQIEKCSGNGLEAVIRQEECFKPAFPNPTYREVHR